MATSTPAHPSLLCSIPPELLGEIFAYSSFQQPDAPLVLSAVCRTFHRVVRSTPNAWTCLYLQVSRPVVAGSALFEHPDARWVRKAELWFAMAGICPMHLHVQMDVPARPSRLQSLGEVPTSFGQEHGNGDDRDAHGQWHIQLLPCMLYQYRYRIHGLSLQSTTVDEAQTFFTALCPPRITDQITDDLPLPLKSLTFNASSDGSHRASSNLTHLPHKHKPATCISLSHCQLPNLAHLKFINHPLPSIINNSSDSHVVPWGPINNAQNLRSLSIIYPIRFAPISIYTLLEVLRSAPLLEKFEIEARVVDAAPPYSLIPTSPPLTPTPLSLPTTPITPNTPLSAHSAISSFPHHPDLITLPCLVSLSLRINNLPALLGHLVLPSLQILRLDDLDGKRAGAASQTGFVLRQLLVRMELPCEDVQCGPGLQVLDMCGIALASLTQAHGGEEHTTVDDAGAVWEWCFRRMCTLRELRATKMDTEKLLALITSQSAMGRSMEDEADEVMLPNLQTLFILDYPSSPSSPVTTFPLASPLRLPQSPSASSAYHFSRSLSPSSFYPTSPMSSSFVRPMSGSLLKFQLRRPEVYVDYHRKHDLNPQPPNVDFLDLYSGHR